MCFKFTDHSGIIIFSQIKVFYHSNDCYIKKSPILHRVTHQVEMDRKRLTIRVTPNHYPKLKTRFSE